MSQPVSSNSSTAVATTRVSSPPKLQLLVLILGVFMAILDTSVVNVAIPSMESAFDATTNQIQWVMTGYMLTIGVLVPISGWLTDVLGAKHLFLWSLAIFTIGSALCGMAWNTPTLIFFRIIQALGGGFMMPVAQSIMFRVYPPERRGFVMGVFGIAIMAAPAFGPALSGYLVEYASWRFIFYVNVPFGILACLIGVFSMKELSHKVTAGLDYLGFALSTLGFFSLLYGLTSAPSDGWKSAKVISFLVIGIVSLLGLVLVELSIKHPIMDFRLFKDYMFSMSTIISSLLNISFFASLFLLPLYLQNVLGMSALRTGLLMTPAALATAVMMPISGKLFDKLGARPLSALGLAIITIATALFTRLGLNTSYAYIQWLYILRNLGMGLTMMPVMTAGMNTLPNSMMNQGSAVSNTARQVAASLGTAVLTTILTQRAKFHTAVLSWQVTPGSVQAQAIQHIQQGLQMKGLPVGAAHQAALGLFAKLLSGDGFVMGLNDTFYVAMFLGIVAFILALFFASRKEAAIRKGHSSAEADGFRPALME